MKNRIDHGSSKSIYTDGFYLDKFIESDEPGTLSWLNMEENDLFDDIPPFRELDLNSVVFPCTGIQQNRQDILYQLKCVWCRSQQIVSPGKMGFRDKKSIRCQLKCVWRRNQQNESSTIIAFHDISSPETA